MDDLEFYARPYLSQMDATVASAFAPSEAQIQALRAARWTSVPPEMTALRMDRTIFYPEGGGQPGDRGVLLIAGRSIPILSTVKLRSNIAGRHDPADAAGPVAPVHLAACAPGTLKAGDRVRLVLDWEHRYLHMRLHTAQHILSGLLWTMFRVGTVSVHMGAEALTIETDRETFSDDEAGELEDLANDAVLASLAVTSRTMAREDALALGLRRSIKVDGPQVRIVAIDGVDQIACGGLHVRRTCECGLIAYQGQERIRGRARLLFKAGPAARRQRKEDRRAVASLCALRSEQPALLVENVRALQDAYETQKAASGRMARRLAEAILQERISPEGIAAFAIDLGKEGLPGPGVFAGALDLYDDLAALVLARDQGRVLWLAALKGRYASIPFNEIRRRVLEPLGAKGGGRSPLFQGVALDASEADLEAAAAGFRALAKENHGK